MYRASWSDGVDASEHGSTGKPKIGAAPRRQANQVRKLVVGINHPPGAKIDMWRINTRKYDRVVFKDIK